MEVVDNRRTSVLDKIKDNPFVKKVFRSKKLRLVISAIIIALALIIYSGVSEKKTEEVSTVMDEEETRLSKVLSSIEGAGQVEVMIVREDGVVTGVLVVAEGAKDIGVMLKLLDATSTVMGVDKSVVEVYQMEQV
ncbi:MAG: hypothetical protein IKB54_05090 [Clostridia bacterium]|nr:hypothetical protein [Clostridia bacterium]